VVATYRVEVVPVDGGGWRVEGSPTRYTFLLQANDEARRFLQGRGGGELVVRDGDGRSRATQRIQAGAGHQRMTAA
jgi:uncharacterized protein DUF2188